jgi:hypothetical protein
MGGKGMIVYGWMVEKKEELDPHATIKKIGRTRLGFPVPRNIVGVLRLRE